MSVNFDELYKGSYYTIIGCGGDLEEWKKGYTNLLQEKEIGTIKEWVTFKGADVNSKYKLTGDNRFKDDLTFLAFPLDGLDVSKLALFKLEMNDRWFDDIISNTLRNQNEDE